MKSQTAQECLTDQSKAQFGVVSCSQTSVFFTSSEFEVFFFLFCCKLCCFVHPKQFWFWFRFQLSRFALSIRISFGFANHTRFGFGFGIKLSFTPVFGSTHLSALDPNQRTGSRTPKFGQTFGLEPTVCTSKFWFGLVWHFQQEFELGFGLKFGLDQTVWFGFGFGLGMGLRLAFSLEWFGLVSTDSGLVCNRLHWFAFESGFAISNWVWVLPQKLPPTQFGFGPQFWTGFSNPLVWFGLQLDLPTSLRTRLVPLR